MDKKVVLFVYIALSIAAIMFIGSGITGFVTSETDNLLPNAINGADSFYIGLIFVFALVLFITQTYGDLFVKDKDQDKPS